MPRSIIIGCENFYPRREARRAQVKITRAFHRTRAASQIDLVRIQIKYPIAEVSARTRHPVIPGVQMNGTHLDSSGLCAALESEGRELAEPVSRGARINIPENLDSVGAGRASMIHGQIHTRAIGREFAVNTQCQEPGAVIVRIRSKVDPPVVGRNCHATVHHEVAPGRRREPGARLGHRNRLGKRDVVGRGEDHRGRRRVDHARIHHLVVRSPDGSGASRRNRQIRRVQQPVPHFPPG